MSNFLYKMQPELYEGSTMFFPQCHTFSTSLMAGKWCQDNQYGDQRFIRGWNFSYPIFVPLEITFISKWRQRTNFNEYKNSQMSWFDTSSFSSFAKTALTQAQNLQKSIDRVLDIEDDASSASNSSGKLVTIFMVLNCVNLLYLY